MMNFNGYIDTGEQFNAAFSNSSLTGFYNIRNPQILKCLDGLDEKARKEVMKHIDEFQTVEQVEMFINQKIGRGKNFY
ncbi:MAG TPA: hypothetical protein PK304_03095 [Mobilitalea sp.]|nr:hypothetical protein [Mobilitalea sp.]